MELAQAPPTKEECLAAPRHALKVKAERGQPLAHIRNGGLQGVDAEGGRRRFGEGVGDRVPAGGGNELPEAIEKFGRENPNVTAHA